MRFHEDAVLIPDLTQWVKNLVCVQHWELCLVNYDGTHNVSKKNVYMYVYLGHHAVQYEKYIYK